ncbi:MAG: cytochrome c3 family protein [Thermoleophilia bacterium]
MRKIAIMSAIVLSVVVVLAFSATAMAATVSPHGGYSTTTAGGNTDYCLTCHDVHEAQGDYVLMRKNTVTAVCGTCHGLFGATAGTGGAAGVVPNWGKADFTGADPTASGKSAYKVSMPTSMTTDQMDAVPGHSLGVMNGKSGVDPADPNGGADAIPGGSGTLKVMTSGLYNGTNRPAYASSYASTGGLYCASCHTPHGDFGQKIPGAKLLSSKPNHSATAITASQSADGERQFCLACHNLRASQAAVGPNHNHPDSVCLTCHGNEYAGAAGAVYDFPHSSSIKRMLTREPDTLCTSCHSASSLP